MKIATPKINLQLISGWRYLSIIDNDGDGDDDDDDKQENGKKMGIRMLSPFADKALIYLSLT